MTRRFAQTLLVVVQIEPDGPWHYGETSWWRDRPDGSWQAQVEYRKLVKRYGWDAEYLDWFPSSQIRLWPADCRRWHPTDPKLDLPPDLCGAFNGTGACTSCGDGRPFEPLAHPVSGQK